MYQVHRDILTTDHIIARSIYGVNGELLLGRGAQLTQEVLRLLPEVGQEFYWVQDENLVEIQFDPVIREQLAMQTSHEIIVNAQKFREAFDLNCRSLGEIKKNFGELHKFAGAIDHESMKKNALALVQGVMGSPAILLNLHGVRSRSGWIHQNAMESAITALMIGKKFELPHHELEEMAIGCLLMDTGYLALPEELVNRQDRITWDEYLTLRMHPEIGFEILRANPGVPLISAHVAWQHHECQDGAGYPRQLRGAHKPPYIRTKETGAIHRYAEIAQVAEAYVRLMHPRNPRQVRNPLEVIRILLKASLSRFNRTIVDALVTMIPLFPPGSKVVVLHDPEGKWRGWKGIVTRVPQDNPEHPDVQIIQDPNGVASGPFLLHLVDMPDLKIQHVNRFA